MYSEEKHLPLDEENSTENQENLIEKVKSKYTFHIKTFAFLSLLVLTFLTFSIISFHRSDVEQSTLSISDLLGLLDGNPEVIARQSITKNWLGLVGVYISDILLNKTFGYPILIILFLGIYLSFAILRKNQDYSNLGKTTIFWTLMMLFASGFFGSIQKFNWLGTIPFEWSGLVGYFFAHLISSVLGNYGAFLIFVFAIFLTIFYRMNFKISDIIKYLYSNTINFFKNRKESKDESPKDTSENPIDENQAQDAENITESDANDSSTSELIDSIANQNIENTTKESTKKPIEFHIVNNDAVANSGVVSSGLSDIPFSTRNRILNIEEDNQVAGNTPAPSTKGENLVSNSRIKPEPEQPKKFTPQIKLIDPSKVAMPNKDFQEEMQHETEELKHILDEEHIEYHIDNEEKFPNESKVDNVFTSINNPSDNKISEIDELLNQIEWNKQNENNAQTESNQNEIIPDIKSVKDEKLTQSQPDYQDQKNVRVTILPETKSTDTIKSLIYTDHSEMKINYKFPPLDLLIKQPPQSNVDYEEFKANAQILQEKLETFKIVIENMTITPGPVVTLYEFVPAPGIKISRIESLSDDLAMALKAKGIRILAPMPGKGTVGVEIPNAKPQIVRFGDIVSSDKYQVTSMRLPLAFGKTINGEVFIEDLTKMPHLLIAGSTGSGKSVGVNTIINSLLFKIHPADLKFVIIDPKKVEMPQYAALSQHYLATSPDVEDLIVTNPKDAVLILKSCVVEMENRYDILADAGQRNIHDYNAKFYEGKIRKSEKIKHSPMPYIVVIIDELADLMLTASKEIEEPITRLAQMARAVGIHLIVATQRPSVDVITGLIKANFPARIAYLASSRIDSRTILDQQGADQLLGNGDMLILPPGTPKPIRVQNAFISTDEVDNICEFIASQTGYPEPYILPSVDTEEKEEKYMDPNDRDPLFEEAAKLIVMMQQASVSMLQRRMKIGYARAGRIMDELEAAGIVGEGKGSKMRDVLLDSLSQLEAYL